MHADLLKMNQLIGLNVFNPTYDALIDGLVGRIGGFDVYVSDYVGSFTTANAKKAIDAADLATDLEASIAYHPNFVRYGMGNKKSGGIHLAFSDGGLQMSYGDVINGWLRVGASPAYKAVSNVTTGIVTIKEVV